MADVLPENDRREAYTAADGQDVFDITFPLEDADDLQVYQNGGFIVGYVVDLNALTVTLDVSVTLGDSIVLIGVTLVKRERNYPRRGGLDTLQLNGEMTQIIRILQETKRDAVRTIGLSPAENDGVDGTLPVLISNGVIIVNGAGDGFDFAMLSDFPNDIPVVLTGLTDGDFLSYDGTNWINITSAELQSELNISSGDVSGLGDIVSYDAADFLTSDTDLQQPETGDCCYSYRPSKAGWVLATGTIGSATSGATTRANADTEDLFALLWAQVSNTEIIIQTSAGVDTVRGASAAADWTADKRLPVPDERGRVSVGRDDMGGVIAGIISLSRPEGLNGVKLGAIGGNQEHVLTNAEMPIHNHNISMQASNQTAAVGGLEIRRNGGATVTSDAGGDEPHNNVQPGIIKNAFVKL